VESSTKELVSLFRSVEPGVIMVSGGEPLLWKAMPDLLEELSQHYWVILTNLSRPSSWLNHERVKLVIAAYHHEFTGPLYVTWLKELNERTPGKAVAKILIFPGEEYRDIDLHRKLNNLGVPAHFAPVEWPRGFDPAFLKELSEGKYLTSAMYNSRFYSRGVEEPRLCQAGTANMFQINPGGGIGRCSQSSAVPGARLKEPSFYDEPRPCTKSCYCEWHHWAGMTLANDNEVWNHYADTGEWTYPTPDDLREFVRKMKWKPWPTGEE